MSARRTIHSFVTFTLFIILSLLGSLLARADQPTEASIPAVPLLSVDFETIPEGLILRSPEIVLDGDVRANGALSVQGEVESTAGGFRFPDGSVQTTASGGALAEQIGSLSPNLGLYSNRIPDISHGPSYVEVCFNGGPPWIDQHVSGGATAGGYCQPGDVGWIMETYERTAETWEMAKERCLEFGMRLPEPFEFKYCCKRAVSLGIPDLANGYEWAGNTATLLSITEGGPSDRHGLAAPLFGAGCNYAVIGWIAVINGEESSYSFRCVR